MKRSLLTFIIVSVGAFLGAPEPVEALSCVGPSSTTLVLELVSLEAVDGTTPVSSERGRIGRIAEFSGFEGGSSGDAGGLTVWGTFRANTDSHHLERTAP